MVAVAAPMSAPVVRRLGSKLVATGGLLSISGGLLWISTVSGPATTYGQIVPGLLLLGLGAGLVMATATDSVIGSVPRGEAGVGAATNGVSIQLGGALGVAVIGSPLSTRYQHHLTSAVAGTLPAGAFHTALGSIGGALEVAAQLPGVLAASLAEAASSALS